MIYLFFNFSLSELDMLVIEKTNNEQGESFHHHIIETRRRYENFRDKMMREFRRLYFQEDPTDRKRQSSIQALCTVYSSVYDFYLLFNFNLSELEILVIQKTNNEQRESFHQQITEITS